ncbi:MAG: hypothetical protein LBT51_03395 [Fusobacteriaceae bacterium]|jgi:type II pantothenate kinase|nr:hypothetical protein [Fusobacteriaceae bacterium]
MLKNIPLDIHKCDKIIYKGIPILCMDCGSSYVKTLFFDNNGFVTSKYSYENFSIKEILKSVDTKNTVIILTGVRGDEIHKEISPLFVIRYTEMECISAIATSIGIDQAIIASIGTGTFFIVLENNTGIHFGGTGIGGGTFIGLAARLLNITDPVEVEKLAETGNLTKINHTIEELTNSGISYLTNDYTASNFSKLSGGSPNDIAAGIHSLVAEVIGMMGAQIAVSHKIKTIIFTGAVCKNRLICERLVMCMELFSLKAIFIDKPEFGTCFGGIMRYSREV